LWAHTISHMQTLLRSTKGGTFGTRVDVLFEGVTAMKIRRSYADLVIRVATPAETTAIRADWPSEDFDDSGRVLLLESGGETGYVIAAIVGWHEDTLELGEPSYFVGYDRHDPDTPQWARTPLFGLDGGLGGNLATPEQLTRALLDETPVPDRDRWRTVYIVTARYDTGANPPHTGPVGVFLTKDEAEQAATRLTTLGRASRYWITAAPIAV
jgi:hypothetical protein